MVDKKITSYPKEKINILFLENISDVAVKYFNAFVNFSDAVLGESIEVPTINGKAKIKIEPGTQSGKVLRLRGKGLPSVQGYGTGDQFVHIHIWTPVKISKEEKEILEKLKTSENFSPSADTKDPGFFKRMRDIFS